MNPNFVLAEVHILINQVSLNNIFAFKLQIKNKKEVLQMSKGKFKVQIQICSNCKSHQWCTRHNQASYSTLAMQIQKALHSHDNSIDVEIFQVGGSKMGSFEITCNGTLLFSKLSLGYFPYVPSAVSRILSFIDDSKKGNDLKKYTQVKNVSPNKSVINNSSLATSNSPNKQPKSPAKRIKYNPDYKDPSRQQQSPSLLMISKQQQNHKEKNQEHQEPQKHQQHKKESKHQQVKKQQIHKSQQKKKTEQPKKKTEVHETKEEHKEHKEHKQQPKKVDPPKEQHKKEEVKKDQTPKQQPKKQQLKKKDTPKQQPKKEQLKPAEPPKQQPKKQQTKKPEPPKQQPKKEQPKKDDPKQGQPSFLLNESKGQQSKPPAQQKSQSIEPKVQTLDNEKKLDKKQTNKQQDNYGDEQFQQQPSAIKKE